jgi:hypothetical protein
MAETCMVFCRSGACDLQAAEGALLRCGMEVRRAGGGLIASRPGSPPFRVHWVTAPHVLIEAQEIGAGTAHEAGMREAAARFEIGFDDLDEALDEINTLMAVQGALQDASRGFLFLPWNGRLMGPT